MDSSKWQIYILLLSSFFYCQVWLIPLTWPFALLCGTCMPTLFQAGLSTHLLNVLAVACNIAMSRVFLRRLITTSGTMLKHLDCVERRVGQMGSERALFALISLRMLPGSPNTLYNIMFPHIRGIYLWQNLLSVAIG